MSYPPPSPGVPTSPLFDPVLAPLDRIVQVPAAAEYLLAAGEELLDGFPREDPGACVPLDPKRFPGLPVHIRSVRLFALMGGASGPRERHPNSYQRVLSLQGSGTIQIWAGACGGTLPASGTLPRRGTLSDGGRELDRRIRSWKESASVVHQLQSDPRAPLHSRWSSVPPGLWHRPSAEPDAVWLTLALHTADSGSLIDEYVEEDGIPGAAGPTLS